MSKVGTARAIELGEYIAEMGATVQKEVTKRNASCGWQHKCPKPQNHRLYSTALFRAVIYYMKEYL